MKPTPLSSVLADDLLLDRIGARLDTDDELGSMLLAVAHSADTPIPRPVVGRRARRHRGLTVIAALGVAVSGATVAAAVELGPIPPDQAYGMPHSRSLLPPGLQALVLPFLNGTPFQGRLFLPYGGVPAVPTSDSATAAGLPGPASPSAALFGEPVVAATAVQEAQLDRQDQQDARQKSQAKGTPADGQGSQGSQGSQAASGDEQDEQGEDTAATPEPPKADKPPRTEPTPPPNQANQGTVPPANTGNGVTNGHANGIVNGNGNANGRGATGSTGSTGSTGGAGSTGGTGSTGAGGSGAVPGDPPGSGAPAKGKAPTGDPTAPGGGSKRSATGAASTDPTGTTATTTATPVSSGE
jgi:hypothetical protein